MCKDCYVGYGSPSAVTDKITKAVELIENLYEQDHCSAGGYAHIVTDDWELEDENIQWCLDNAIAHKDNMPESSRWACIETLEHLKMMNETERATALALFHGFLTVE